MNSKLITNANTILMKQLACTMFLAVLEEMFKNT
jgi:hypothetical protein